MRPAKIKKVMSGCHDTVQVFVHMPGCTRKASAVTLEHGQHTVADLLGKVMAVKGS